MALLITISVVYVLGLCFLLWVSRKNRGLYALAKGVCSTLFVLCAIFAFIYGGQNGTAAFAIMLAGLVLCACGDILLGIANRNAKKVSKKPFVLGAVFFSFAHLAFCAMFYAKLPFNWYDLILPVICVILVFMLEKSDKIRLKKIKPLALVYSFLVGLMTGKAASMLFLAGGLYIGDVILAMGAVLFFISDVILMFLYFGTNRRKLMRGANLVTYYVGIYLMALSAYWLK